MTHFDHGSIQQIPTDNDTVLAFQIHGHIDDDASEALAKFMNDAFDKHPKVNMLLDMAKFTGSDWDSIFDSDVVKSRFRSLQHVGRYAVVGAPDRAAKMIALMNKVIPVEARAFDADEITQAWDFVGAQPITA
ncbi:SpoIIAA-like [Yoonia rosea]|uniref:SpoIIAA-like n=1 Tax=Yoonia rosea TaxID=287098 RepID=A0A1R3XHQ9_9RHOB|nr:STAS/SEC14 domain-containing protein [Yoonia rosea]SIT90355.1 SpoIIAA-like [Yoonia rosea]